MIGRLVDRFGRTGFAALSSLIWALPMAAWAGSADLSPIDKSEKRWTLALAAFATGLIAWLNGAATVDWSPLVTAIAAGKIGPTLLAVALAIFLIAMLAGIGFSWRREGAAFRNRAASSLSNVG